MATETKKLTGTHEWAEKTVNIQYGCENNCRYCYAKKMAARFNRISPEGWEHPIPKDLDSIKLPHNTQVMFPSTHDITPANLTQCKLMLTRLLNRGNHILIVSKPRLQCIREILEMTRLTGKMPHHVEFRLTIGTLSHEKQQFWEHGAPSINERIQCVEFLEDHGIFPSISCEPLLDDIERYDGNPWEKGIRIVDLLLGHNIKEIWIGAMNYMKGAPQLDYAAIYQRYKGHPLIKWKESFRKHLEGGEWPE